VPSQREAILQDAEVGLQIALILFLGAAVSSVLSDALSTTLERSFQFHNHPVPFLSRKRDDAYAWHDVKV